jgi:hypothetical protein
MPIWSTYDYASLVVPFLLWIALTLLGIGPQSLSNVLELFAIVLLVPLLLSARIFLLDAHATPFDPALLVLALACVGTVLLRLFMPCLPE